MKLKKKVALVTGAGKGIGKGIALGLAKQGAHIVVNYAHSAEGAKNVVSQIHRIGGQAMAVKADIARKEDIEEMFQQAIRKFGKIDILVNNSGWDPGYVNFKDIDETFYCKLMDINVKGALFCALAAAKEMIRMGKGGKIINISSVQSMNSVKGHTVYAMSKGSLDSMTRQLALEFAEYKINVNAVAPGFIPVERVVRNIESYNAESEGETIPVGRVGTIEDIASMVAYLSSEDADFITGQIITVDGGVSCKLSRK